MISWVDSVEVIPLFCGFKIKVNCYKKVVMLFLLQNKRFDFKIRPDFEVVKNNPIVENFILRVKMH